MTLLLNQLSMTGDKMISLKECLAMFAELQEVGWEFDPGMKGRLEGLLEEDLRVMLEDFEENIVIEKLPVKVICFLFLATFI